MYQGLIINCLSRAAWKKSSYKGRELQPGQFGAVISHLAVSLGVPRSTLQRMVAHLEEDGLLEVTNVGNHFSIITIVNWHTYQETESGTWATDGQPAVNQRATGGQPSYKEEEGKKERKKNIKNPPIAPLEGGDGEAAPSAFAQFWEAYPKKLGKKAAAKAWGKARDKPALPDLLAAVERQKAWPQWQRDGGQYIPHPASWLNQGRWSDEPYIEPAPTTALAIRDGPPVAKTQYQKQRQDQEGLAAAVLEADRRFAGHGNDTANHNRNRAHGNALQPATGLCRVGNHSASLDGLVPRPDG